MKHALKNCFNLRVPYYRFTIERFSKAQKFMCVLTKLVHRNFLKVYLIWSQLKRMIGQVLLFLPDFSSFNEWMCPIESMMCAYSSLLIRFSFFIFSFLFSHYSIDDSICQLLLLLLLLCLITIVAIVVVVDIFLIATIKSVFFKEHGRKRWNK